MRVKSHQLPITMRMATEFTDDSPPAECRGVSCAFLSPQPPVRFCPPWLRSKSPITCALNIIFLQKKKLLKPPIRGKARGWQRADKLGLESSDEKFVITSSLPAGGFYLIVAGTSRATAQCKIFGNLKFMESTLRNSVNKEFLSIWRSPSFLLTQRNEISHFTFINIQPSLDGFPLQDFQKALLVKFSKKLPLCSQLFLSGPLGGGRGKLLPPPKVTLKRFCHDAHTELRSTLSTLQFVSGQNRTILKLTAGQKCHQAS